MQYARNRGSAAQPDLLHHALMSSRLKAQSLTTAAMPDCEPDNVGFSEICLNGAPRQCLQWLAPVLRDLSQANMPGWLTLIAPPLPVSQKWLRAAGLDPQRILIIRPKHGMDVVDLCCEILQLGYSHAVVSWLPTSPGIAHRLEMAARSGHCASLNIRMGNADATPTQHGRAQ